jgi:acetyltransferase-like isoleucine patch superfamily enzyme
MNFFYIKIANLLSLIIKKPFWFFYNYILFKFNNVAYLEFPKIHGFILLKNRGKIILGRNCIITSNKNGNPVGSNSNSYIYCSPGGIIKIGENVSLSNALIFSQENITISDYVMIGGGVQIWDTDFHPLSLNARIVHDKSKIKTKSVFLERGCFIGANSLILKGVRIGENSIIAAGSVVSKSVPKNEIWGGNPAKFIKLND